MEKNTILAIVLSAVVLIVTFTIQGILAGQRQLNEVEHQVQTPDPGYDYLQQVTQSAGSESPQAAGTPSSADSAQQVLSQQVPSTQVPSAQGVSAQESAQGSSQFVPVQGGIIAADISAGFISEEIVRIETDVIIAELTNAGGDMVSWKLKDHNDKSESVDMIFSGTSGARAFSIAFGDNNAAPITENFQINRLTDHIVEFYRDFIFTTPVMEEKFRLTKRYEFKPTDYMFELTVTLDGGFSKYSFDFFGNAYTLFFGPQIGPRFEKLDRYHEYRQYFTFANGKRRNAKLNDTIENRPSWAAITGKYFTLIALPYLAEYSISFSERAETGIPSASRLIIQRPRANTSVVTDMYRFYLGPRSQNELAKFNTGNNGFNIKDSKMSEVSSSRGVLAPLEVVLKWLLIMFYKVVKNYGVAIILLTLLIKILFFPLTKKGSEATIRMQALAPKIKELQEKYKSNPQKLQQEMAAFYKQEGYNPLSGCLPMLLQLPIFITMYGLFNNHFDLRGAMFIPGWIPDLSAPEAIFNFPGDFALPIVGWTAIRALPFIYVASQLMYGKVTQMPGQQSNTQMKMMLYVMPIAFFFILYNVPSGLLIYWIFSNLLTLVQQVIINKYIIKKKAAQKTEPEPVIAPKKKKK